MSYPGVTDIFPGIFHPMYKINKEEKKIHFYRDKITK